MNVDTAILEEQEREFVLISEGSDPAEVRAARIEFAQERLLQLTRKMLAGYPKLRRWEETDDVYQRAMLRLNRALSKIEVESLSHFFNLAALQVRRELIDLARFYFGQYGPGANHHTDRKPADDPGGAIQLAKHGPDDLEDWEQFHAAIDELPPEESEVFHLFYYQGLKQQVAAELLQIPLRTFKRRLQQAKIRLQSRLNREDKPRAIG